MSSADISISELNQAERRFVVRAFLRTVGADVTFPPKTEPVGMRVLR